MFLHKFKVLFILLLFGQTTVFAQRYLGEAKVQCPESVLIGENFVFKVSIPVGTEFRGIVLPSFDKVGINVLFGPSKSLLSSVTTVNGKVDSTSVTTYNYVLSVKGNMKVVTVPSFLIKNEANGDIFLFRKRQFYVNMMMEV